MIRWFAVHVDVSFRLMVRLEPRAVSARSNLVSIIAQYRYREVLGSRCGARDDRHLQNHNLLMAGELPNLFFNLFDQR